MVTARKHAGIFAFDELPSPGESSEDEIVIPENLEEVTDEDLDALEARATEAFDALFSEKPTDSASVATLTELTEAIEVCRTEKTRREEERANALAAAEELNTRIHGVSPEEPDGGDGGEDDELRDAAAATAQPAPEPEPVAAAAQPRQTQPAEPRRTRRINFNMAEVRARAPQPEVAPQLAITAAADVPRYGAGHTFANISELADAFAERAKSAPLTASGSSTGPKVATIHRQYEHVISSDTSPADVSKMLKEITNQQSLVAGGGWCAPSEISYSFFDITCEDGMIDIPEFGVSRGGLRWPISPSLADVYTGTFTNASNPWLWTETDDILTVTGSTNKPCVRVPCPTFDERRLECYGLCLTAGNLTDNAFPEATERQLGLLQSAHFHAQNARYIATMLALSSATVTGGFFDQASSIAADLPAAVGWAATDYRTRYGMCQDTIMEVVLPIWALEVMRSDLSRRNGVDMEATSNAEIGNFFDVRNVRVQYVNDWQIRTGNQPGGSSATVLYPTTVDFMIFAAGTFARGNGMTLDLGVVRDSVLNAENDHTAAWTEECHLIAKLGHESRRYTVNICAAGRTGQANITDCQTS